jgi:hypothetical protein
MFRNWTGVLLALGLGLSAMPAAASFENVAVSPRARAMGESAVAMADDAFAPYYNPAGLALLGGPTFAASYVRPYGVSFLDLGYVGGAFPLGGRRGTLGVGLRRLATEYEGALLDQEQFATLAYGIKLYEDMHSAIRVGAAINAYDLRFGPTVGDGEDSGFANGLDPGNDVVVGADAGLLITLHERTRMGVFVKNINNPQIGLDREEIGQRLHGGIAYAPYDRVWTSFEFENLIGRDVIYHGGVEVGIDYGLTLRLGVLTNPNKATAGFGYRWRGVSVDYGFSTGGGVLDGSHQFGVSYAWGGEAQ